VPLLSVDTQSLVSRFGWKPMEEEGRIIGVTMDGQSVTLEPGRRKCMVCVARFSRKGSPAGLQACSPHRARSEHEP